MTGSLKTISDVQDDVKLGFIWSKNELNVAQVTLRLPVLNITPRCQWVLGRGLVLASAVHPRCTRVPGDHVANAAGTCLALLPRAAPLVAKDSSLGTGEVCAHPAGSPALFASMDRTWPGCVPQRWRAPEQCEMSWGHEGFGEGSAPQEGSFPQEGIDTQAF